MKTSLKFLFALGIVLIGQSIQAQTTYTYTLYDGDTDQALVSGFNNNISWDLDVSDRLSVVSDIASGIHTQVKFTLSNGHNQTESNHPYASHGDNSGNFTPWTQTAEETLSFQVDYLNGPGNITQTDNFTITFFRSSTAADTTPPSVPGGLASSAQTENSIDLSWNASTDDSGTIASYEVWMNSALLSNVSNTTSYTATGLSASTSYSFQVLAVDLSGNKSNLSSALSVSTNAASGGGSGGSTSSPWTESGSNIYYSGSNVGIGTSAPSARLDVRGSVASSNNNGNMLAFFSSGDGNSYFNFSGGSSSSRLGFQIDGTSRMSLTNSGYLGIGTAAPTKPLHVMGDQKIENTNAALVIQGNGTGDYHGGKIIMSALGVENDHQFASTRVVMHRGTTGKGVFELQRLNPAGAYTGTTMIYSDGIGWRFHTANADTSTGTTQAMLIDENGNVGIGTTDPGDWKLAVDGKIRAREIRVDNDAWPDYVFAKDYNLPSLAEVRAFIKKYGHLPDVPSAKEVEEEGVELGEMNKILLQKIEELTLYVLELDEELKELEKENK